MVFVANRHRCRLASLCQLDEAMSEMLVPRFDHMENIAVPTRQAKQWQHYQADKTMRLARKKSNAIENPTKVDAAESKYLNSGMA